MTDSPVAQWKSCVSNLRTHSGPSTAYENVDSSSVPLHTRHLSSGKDQTLITYVVLDLYLKHYLLEISCNDLPPSLALAVICSTSH